MGKSPRQEKSKWECLVSKSWQVLGTGSRCRGKEQTKVMWEGQNKGSYRTGSSEEFVFILSGGC